MCFPLSPQKEKMVSNHFLQGVNSNQVEVSLKRFNRTESSEFRDFRAPQPVPRPAVPSKPPEAWVAWGCAQGARSSRSGARREALGGWGLEATAKPKKRFN